MRTREQELRFNYDMNVLRINGLMNFIQRADPFNGEVDRAIAELRLLQDENKVIWKEIYTLTGIDVTKEMEQWNHE